MIRSFRHKGLENFFLYSTKSGIHSPHATRLRLILGALDSATKARDMVLPGLHIHRLSGGRHETWSVRISANWHVTFRFIDGEAVSVDYEDYH